MKINVCRNIFIRDKRLISKSAMIGSEKEKTRIWVGADLNTGIY